MPEFQNKVALITGGGSGIGQAAALEFGDSGAIVVVVDREKDNAEATAAMIRGRGGRASAYVADAASSSDVAACVAETIRLHARIDIFFCNAGIRGPVLPIFELSEAGFDEVIRVNLRSVFVGLKEVLPIMKAQGDGSVVVTCSTASLNGLSNMPGYAASKHGALGLVRAAAIEMVPHGVRVNAICPGATKTPLLSSLYALANTDAPRESKRRAGSMPMGRLVEAEEIADMCLYLCSESARNITGAYFLVDGGHMVVAGTGTAGAGVTEKRAAP